MTWFFVVFFLQAEDGIRDFCLSRGLGDVYERQDGNYLTIHAILNGHQNAVRCMCELPNGDLLTGGGKMDATLQLWTSAYLKNPVTTTSTQEQEETQVPVQSKAKKTLGDVGYVFSLAVLPNAKPDSNHFAIAAA